MEILCVVMDPTGYISRWKRMTVLFRNNCNANIRPSGVEAMESSQNELNCQCKAQLLNMNISCYPIKVLHAFEQVECSLEGF